MRRSPQHSERAIPRGQRGRPDRHWSWWNEVDTDGLAWRWGPHKDDRTQFVGYRDAVAEIRRMVACTESLLCWDAGREPAMCRNDDHQHRVFETHRHLDPVILPDGTRLTAASFDPEAPYSRARDPDYGLYLDSRWQPPWSHGHIDWPDFGVPANTEAVIEALQDVLERARSGQGIEVGCLGGHGRTGTALACLAVLTGQSALDPIAWVRSNYCAKAVETPAQEAFIAAFAFL